MKNQRKVLLAETRKFAKANRKILLGDVQSAETTKGIFGFRLSNPRLATVAKATWDKVIANAKRNSLVQFIRKVEEVDKDRVKAEASPEELEALGCKVTQSESFFVKAKDPGAAKVQKVA
ncbi:MAG: host-nuclease inhibitor Gam family protein [Verrucomicrobia bacterium]|nr:host-nuclease inhibitor Gam family protein [Verrucomicrobiota bacterium]